MSDWQIKDIQDNVRTISNLLFYGFLVIVLGGMFLFFRTQTLEYELKRFMIKEMYEANKETRENFQESRKKMLDLATYEDIKRLRQDMKDLHQEPQKK